jgi:peroxiredoxin
MSATESTMLSLGTHAPAFTLPDVENKTLRSLEDFAGSRALLVVFLCAHCPYVLHVAPALAQIARDYAHTSLAIIGITSNDTVQYPQDASAPTARFAAEQGLSFPILFDETQRVAQAYSAACTPDFFLFNEQRALAYRGQIDESRPMRGPDRPGKGVCDGADLRAAIDAVLAGRPAPEPQKASIGCNIKWKAGNEPSGKWH